MHASPYATLEPYVTYAQSEGFNFPTTWVGVIGVLVAALAFTVWKLWQERSGSDSRLAPVGQAPACRLDHSGILGQLHDMRREMQETASAIRNVGDISRETQRTLELLASNQQNLATTMQRVVDGQQTMAVSQERLAGSQAALQLQQNNMASWLQQVTNDLRERRRSGSS